MYKDLLSRAAKPENKVNYFDEKDLPIDEPDITEIRKFSAGIVYWEKSRHAAFLREI